MANILGSNASEVLVGDIALNKNDVYTALNGADTLIGGLGNDLLDGGLGFDEVRYTAPGTKITLLSQGVISKGAVGTDTIAGVERIVGVVGQANRIDGLVVGAQTTAFQIDLAAEDLLITGVPFTGELFFEVANFLEVRGTANADVILGNAGANLFLGSDGDDLYDGRAGIDTIDYSALGNKVTLLAQGVIRKGGGLGEDTIAGMEAIVGAAGQANKIDGAIEGNQSTSFNVNLGASTLTINGIPGGPVGFSVVNFVDVRGTDNNDSVVGSSAANRFYGTEGTDTYNGLGGNDAVDYSGLGGAVTLLSQGVISKGSLGTDSILGIEKIVGAAGFANKIDGEVIGAQVTRFDIDLAIGELAVRDVPGLGTIKFDVVNFRDVRGTTNSDTVFGSAVANVFTGTAGGDAYDGRDGFDTIDYADLGAVVTLLAQGVIDKGALGEDTIAGMEKIIGSNGFINLIDGEVSSPGQTTSFDIDLTAGTLVVNGIPGIGFAAFEIENFRNVRGTANADQVIGGSNANIFFGSAGNDAYDGAGGVDTIDYTDLGAGVTLLAQGVIAKGLGLGTDTILGMETIIGDVGGGIVNLIDGTVAVPATQTTSFVINLQAGSLVVNGIPGGPISFDVENFNNVTGTANADNITGDNTNNVLIGAGSNDTLSGGGGNDTLIGAAGSDLLTGGGGKDTFRFAMAMDPTFIDTATDFGGKDKIELVGITFANITQTLANVGGNAGILDVTLTDAISGTQFIALDTGATLAANVFI